MNRAFLKQRAKTVIRNSPRIYLITLLFMLLTASLSLYIQLRGGGRTFGIPAEALNGSLDLPRYLAGQLAEYFSSTRFILLSGFVLLFNLFSAVLSFGYSKYCLHLQRGLPVSAATLFDGFQQFLRIIWLNVLVSLLVFLWSLLFLIPGIIAIYSYSQAQRILIDNPDMTALEAIRASKELMRGNRWELFVLELSFIGWMLLASFTFGILMIWLVPYMEITMAEFYDVLAHGGVAVETPPEQIDEPEEWTDNGF